MARGSGATLNARERNNKMNSYNDKINQGEAEIDASLTPTQRAVAIALWSSVATGDHINGPIYDFGPQAQDFIDRLAEQGYGIHPIAGHHSRRLGGRR
jgi:fructose-1,6-bisphosphatase